MSKKFYMIIATIALVAFLFVGGTIAWFTASSTATNTITTGSVSLILRETIFKAEEDQGQFWTTDISLDDKGNQVGILYGNITPGTVIPKDPNIQYTGSSRAYIRYKVDVEGLPKSMKDKVTIIKVLEDKKRTPVEIGKYIYLDKIFDTSTGNQDDVFYKIFDDVEFSKDLGNDFSKEVDKIKIIITVDAVQADNFSVDFESATPWGEDFTITDTITNGSIQLDEG